jgi:hypothetical protein
VGTAEPQPAAAPAAASQAELETKFAAALSGVELVGRFTNDADGGGQVLKEERYTISKVSKLKGDTWLFQTRIRYGDRDLSLPLPLEVKWAGDTPVITLTDLPIPGLGTFTARVVIYRDQYAGTWSAPDHGGHLFGKIEKSAGGGATGKAPPPRGG